MVEDHPWSFVNNLFHIIFNIELHYEETNIVDIYKL
jgi:hypothetical protein